MKKYFYLAILIINTGTASAQTTQKQSIEDSVLGWVKVYHFKGVKEGQKMDNRVYSVAQLSYCDSLVNWMQASYVPKGGLGDIKKRIFPKANQYHPYYAAWPQGYGATADTWDVSYNSKGKLERIQESETPWAISANGVPGWPIQELCSATAYYFTIPGFEGRDDAREEQDLSKVANLKPYIYFWEKNIEAGNGTEYVLLGKDNKSPFIKLTKREYLQLLEAAIARIYQEEKKKIYTENKDNQKSIDYFMKYLDEKNDKRMARLNNNKEKYKDRLLETAETFAAQPDTKLENFSDVFEGNGVAGIKYPVYKLDPAMVEMCKKDKPQWLLMGWNWNPHNPKEKHLHESIINNFNFEYVYNFFFYPEKVKGQTYKPLRSPVLKEVVTVEEKSEEGMKAALDKSVYYFEDFSTTGVGEKPIGWYEKETNRGVKSVIAKVEGTSNKWAVLAGNQLIPNNLKKPLPQNFTLSYDVIVPENFTWGAKGLVLRLSKEKTEGVTEGLIRLKLRPGSGGSDGEAELETKFPSGYANGIKWYVATGFSNNKKLNRISVSIIKSGEVLQLFIEKKMIVENIKCIPVGMLFNTFSFEMASNDNANDKYYVSNIKITKD